MLLDQVTTGLLDDGGRTSIGSPSPSDIDAQARQAGARRLRARVLDANIAGEAGDVPLGD